AFPLIACRHRAVTVDVDAGLRDRVRSFRESARPIVQGHGKFLGLLHEYLPSGEICDETTRPAPAAAPRAWPRRPPVSRCHRRERLPDLVSPGRDAHALLPRA